MTKALIFIVFVLQIACLMGSESDGESKEDGKRYYYDEVEKKTLEIPDWIPTTADKKGEHKHTRSGTSEHLKTVIDFYNDTQIVIEKLETLMRYEPYSVLDGSVFQHVSSMEAVISKLEDYLAKMKNKEYKSEVEHKKFMDSIDEASEEMYQESLELPKKLEKNSIFPKIKDDFEEMSKIVKSMHEKQANFELSIGFLELYGVGLRPREEDPVMELPSKAPLFDMSVLNDLLKQFKEVEKYEILTLEEWAKEKAEREKRKNDPKDHVELSDEEQRKILLEHAMSGKAWEDVQKIKKSPRFLLEMSEFGIKHLAEDNAAMLKQFVPIVNKMRRKMYKLAEKAAALDQKMTEDLLNKAFDAFPVNKKMNDLIDKVKLEYAKKQKHQEL